MPSVAQAPLADSSLQPPDHDSDVVNDVDNDNIFADVDSVADADSFDYDDIVTDADADSVAEC